MYSVFISIFRILVKPVSDDLFIAQVTFKRDGWSRGSRLSSFGSLSQIKRYLQTEVNIVFGFSPFLPGIPELYEHLITNSLFYFWECHSQDVL